MVGAVLLGGVSVVGGGGTLVGVVLSLAVIATLRNLLALLNVGAEMQSSADGALLILSVLGPNLAGRARGAFSRPAGGIPSPAGAAPAGETAD